MDPKGPSQPTAGQAYTTPGNPAQQVPSESRAAEATRQDNKDATQTETRKPGKGDASIEEATPSSLGQGVRGAGPGEEAKGKTEEDVGQHRELDAEQMGAPGEGRTADAVSKKPGASGGERDLASDLDRKKAEQASLRKGQQDSRNEGIDVQGALADRKGPAAA